MAYKSINTSSAVAKTIKNDDDSYVDYFYDHPGALPGTLDLEPDAAPPEIVLIDYCETAATRSKLANPQEAAAYLDTESVSWVDMLGLGNNETWRQMGEVFNLHEMAQEDVVNVPQRPKVVDYEEHILIIAWMVMVKPNSDNFHKEQVSFKIGRAHV